MKRRKFLSTLAATTGAVLSSGCKKKFEQSHTHQDKQKKINKGHNIVIL